MKRARIGILAVGVLSAAVVPGACSVYDESLLSGGGGNAGDGASAVCANIRWPLPPSSAPAGGDIDFVTALTYFDFGEPYTSDTEAGPVPIPYRDVGYDLDETCTQIGSLDNRAPDPKLNEANSCLSRLKPGFEPIVGDYADGRDNGLGGLIALVKGRLPQFGTYAYNANIKTGKVSLLFRVTGYNGEANDDDVTGIIYSPGAFQDLPDNVGKVPQFNGQDRWPITADSYIDGDEARPKLVSTRAYVTNGLLVARTDDLDLRLRIGVSSQEVTDLRLTFLQPFLTAKIVQEDGLWKLKEGTIAGRWKTGDLFKQLSRFPNPDTYPEASVSDPYFCTGSALYEFVRSYICSAADIYSGPDGPGSPCDSLSVGIAFDAVQAQLGPIVTPPPPPENPCGDFDPANDSCGAWASGAPKPGPAVGDADASL